MIRKAAILLLLVLPVLAFSQRSVKHQRAEIDTNIVKRVAKIGVYFMPIVDGTSGQALVTDGNGTVSWGNAVTDTSHLSARIDTKQAIADTNTKDATRYWVRQQGYVTTTTDTTHLSDRINLKQNISDTSSVDATRYWVGQQGYVTGTPWVGLYWAKGDTTSTLLTQARGASTYEPSITASTTDKYWRGDKTWQTLPTYISSQWVTSGSNIYYTGGNVGIGITNPSGALGVYTTASQNAITGFGTAAGFSGVVGTNLNGTGVYGSGLNGVQGEGGSTGVGVLGHCNYASGGGVQGTNDATGGKGVYGLAAAGIGVYGNSTSSYGMYGTSVAGYGGYFQSSAGTGLAGYAGGSNGAGVYGNALNATGGYFESTNGKGLYVNSVNSYAAIFDAGNVGIGTTAPTAKLHVNGLTKTNTLQVGGYNVSVTSDCSIPQAGGTYSAGYGLSLASTTFSADTSKLVTFGDTAATGGKIATKYGLAAALAGYMSNPMTTNGDIIYQHGGVPTRVPVGTLNQCLRVGPDDGNGRVLTWTDQEWLTSGSNIYRSTGNVGVNTSTPTTAKLQIAGKKTVPFAVSTDNDGSLGDSTAIYVNEKGNIGFGPTVSNTYKTYTTGDSWTTGTVFAAGNADCYIKSNGVSTSYDGIVTIQNATTSANAVLRFNNNGAEALRISNSRNVGIGTTAPTSILSLSGQAAQTFGMERNTTTNTAGNSLTIRASGATVGATDKLGGPLYYYPGASTGNATGISHQWYTYDATTSGTTDQAATPKMTMTSAGKIGIGTTAPSSTLHVTGSARVSDSLKALGKVYATNITRQDTGVYKLLWNSGTGEIKAATNEPNHMYAYYSNNAGATRAFAVTNTYYPLVAALTSPEAHNYSVDADTAAVYYTGESGHVKHYASVTFTGTNGEDIEFQIYNINDGAEVPTSQICSATGTSNRQNVTLVCYDVNATKNDRYQIRIRNTGATNNVIVYRVMWWSEMTHN